jgi:hypothetical protein
MFFHWNEHDKTLILTFFIVLPIVSGTRATHNRLVIRGHHKYWFANDLTSLLTSPTEAFL